MKSDRSIYGLTYDFTNQDGNYVVFYDKEQPLRSADLNALQVKMLQHNSFPHMLPFEKQMVNDEVTLLYRFTSLRMLVHHVAVTPLPLTDFYQLFYSILSLLDDSRCFMLDEAKFVLDERFIFVDRFSREVRLCYLPLHDDARFPTVRDGIDRLALALIPYIKEMKGDDFQQFMKVIRDRDVSLKELLTHVEQLIAPEQPAEATHVTKRAGTEQTERREKRMSAKWWRIIPFKRAKQVKSNAVGMDFTAHPDTYYDELSQHTTVLNEQAGTVLLSKRPHVNEPDTSHDHFHLLINGHMIQLSDHDQSVMIGRNDERYNAHLNPLGVSRQHCEIVSNGTQWYIQDLGSRNGTWLNEQQLTPYKPYELHDDDDIVIVKNKLKVVRT